MCFGRSDNPRAAIARRKSLSTAGFRFFDDRHRTCRHLCVCERFPSSHSSGQYCPLRRRNHAGRPSHHQPTAAMTPVNGMIASGNWMIERSMAASRPTIRASTTMAGRNDTSIVAILTVKPMAIHAMYTNRLTQNAEQTTSHPQVDDVANRPGYLRKGSEKTTLCTRPSRRTSLRTAA